MKNSFKAMMLSAAVTGLLSGSAATPMHASSLHNGAQLGQAALASASCWRRIPTSTPVKAKTTVKARAAAKLATMAARARTAARARAAAQPTAPSTKTTLERHIAATSRSRRYGGTLLRKE